MDQRQLEYFIAVAEELNFTKAAARLFATQSTLSASIKTLEKELGAQLFNRSTARVALTEAGLTFLPEARSASRALDLARESVDQTQQGLRGRLRLGTMMGMTAVDIIGLAGEFHRLYPGVQLQLEVSPTGGAGLQQRVRAHALDLAFIPLGLAGSRDFAAIPIKRFAPRVLVPSDHPLAGQITVSLSQLATEPFVDLPVGFGNRTQIDDEFRRAGLSRQIVVEVMDLSTIGRYVAEGLGIAIVPPLRGEESLNLATIDLGEKTPWWTLNIASATDVPLSRAAQALIDLVPGHTSADAYY